MISAVFVALAVRLSDLQPQALSVVLLVPAIVLAAMAAVGGKWETSIPAGRVYQIVIGLTVAVGIPVFVVSLMAQVEPGGAAGWTAWVLLSLAVSGSAVGMLIDDVGTKASVAFFAFYSLAIAWAIVVASGSTPFIDVVQFQQGAVAAVREGFNPYAIRFPDLYGAGSDLFYGDGVSVDGVLNFGFPYLPLSLALILPFEWLLSDFRIGHAVAIVGAGVLIARTARNAQSRGAAAAFLLISPVIVILEFGWTEPLVVLFATALIHQRTRRRRGVSIVTGLLVSLKQYAVLFLPASLLLFDRPWRLRQIMAHLATAGAVVIVTILPFVVWNFEAFMRSVVELQFLQPFRADSIAFPALYARYFDEPSRIAMIIVPLVVIVLATIATLMRTPTGAQGFALASGLTLLVAFAFSKQAFGNYYLVVIALLFGAAAAGGVGANEEDEDIRGPRARDG